MLPFMLSFCLLSFELFVKGFIIILSSLFEDVIIFGYNNTII
jgi:hypothetical protein